MNEERLYDGSGPPDPEIDRLEALLRPCGHVETPLRALPRARRRVLPAVAAAAACVAIAGGVVAWRLSTRPSSPAGEPEAPVVSSGGARLATGTWIAAEGAHRSVDIAGVGNVTLDPGARLRVAHVTAEETRLYLERGRLWASIRADVRPRMFQVDTDAGRCVDLGCVYELTAEPQGTSRVLVRTGRVVFEAEGRELYVPAGAGCVARRGAPPGTPRFTSAPEALAKALDAFDAAPAAPAADRRRLAADAAALATTPRDTLPLWHWLQDPDEGVRRVALASIESRSPRPLGLSDPAAPWSPSDRERWRSELARGW